MRCSGVDVIVVSNKGHSEGLGSLGNQRTDAANTNDSQGFPSEFTASELTTVPASLLGVGSGLIGFLSLCGVIAMKFSLGTDMTGNPLILVCVLATILAVQFISLGILGETAARIFFQTRGLPPYAVRSTYNLQTEYRGRIGAATATSHFAPREASSETRDPQVAPGKAA